ncbi:hypothetical protein ASD40_35445 [Paenibacillus sp. Root444D2]|nr:hypothetical protein ASD40_35445 [Paenibacillus sp. Root444D2]KRE50008.1 hypothetical protein ASG85_21385 [Paenibacillus sp. Soil724D2]
MQFLNNNIVKILLFFLLVRGGEILGRRLFPIKRYYPFIVWLTMFIVAISIIIFIMPSVNEWLTMLIMFIVATAINIIFPFKTLREKD